MLVSTATLGFPRMGPNRELKFALEKYWKSAGSPSDQEALFQVAQRVEEQAWKLQADAGIDRITVGDQYLYDGVLSWVSALGVTPARYLELPRGLPRMFGMARGVDGATALSEFTFLLTYLLLLCSPHTSSIVSMPLIRYEKVDYQQLPLHGPRVRCYHED